MILRHEEGHRVYKNGNVTLKEAMRLASSCRWTNFFLDDVEYRLFDGKYREVVGTK